MVLLTDFFVSSPPLKIKKQIYVRFKYFWLSLKNFCKCDSWFLTRTSHNEQLVAPHKGSNKSKVCK